MTQRWINALPHTAHWDWTLWDRLLHSLGFRRESDYRLTEDLGRATWDIPAWAQRPGADVIGTWTPFRSRLVWHRLPLWKWRAS